MRIYVLQLIVAGMAATIYVWTLFTLKRAMMRRRRRRARSDSKYLTLLLQGVRDGTIHSLSEAGDLFRTHFLLPDREEIDHMRLGHLIQRASFRRWRRVIRNTRRRGSAELGVKDEQSDAVLARLCDQNSAIRRETIRRRLSQTEREHLEAKVKKEVAEWAKRIHETDARPWRKETSQRMYRLGRRFLTVAGCLLFVWLVLALWNAWT